MPQKPSGTFLYPEPGSSPQAPQIRDLPPNCRPRELAKEFGVQGVEDYVLLAIVLQSGTSGKSVVDLARELLRTFGSLNAIARADIDDLRIKGIGPVRAQILQAAFELARRLENEKMPVMEEIKSPEAVASVLRKDARLLDCEQFWVLLLDAKNRLKGPPLKITQGILDASLVHPREVFRVAISRAAAAVVLAHNHPSGDPTPSTEDVRVTRELVEAGRSLRLRVLDHIIIGRRTAEREKDFISMRESGIVSFSD